MQWFAFDSHKHYTWALVQNEAGKHSSLFPTTYAALIAVCHCLPNRALSEMSPELRGSRVKYCVPGTASTIANRLTKHQNACNSDLTTDPTDDRIEQVLTRRIFWQPGSISAKSVPRVSNFETIAKRTPGNLFLP